MLGSVCVSVQDCTTQFCATGKCTDGASGDACATYKDCAKGLLCQKGACQTLPDYTKYFSRIIISKMKSGMPPGPDNIPVPTTEFKTTDAIEIDFTGVKPQTKGEVYYEFVNAVTGEVTFTSVSRAMKLNGQDMGTGTSFAAMPGAYDLNVYYNNELVYTVPITFVQ
jgi:hypothetical protein